VFFKLLNWMDDRFVDNWRDMWHWYSTWAAGAAVSVLVAWNMMPAAVKDFVPDWIEVAVGLSLWGPILLARLFGQTPKE
jgi:hypothetical protein